MIKRPLARDRIVSREFKPRGLTDNKITLSTCDAACWWCMPHACRSHRGAGEILIMFWTSRNHSFRAECQFPCRECRHPRMTLDHGNRSPFFPPCSVSLAWLSSLCQTRTHTDFLQCRVHTRSSTGQWKREPLMQHCS